jgi:hypothetical protein
MPDTPHTLKGDGAVRTVDIGPECFAGQRNDGTWVISWKGENYAPQRLSLRAWLNNNVYVPAVETLRRIRRER